MHVGQLEILVMYYTISLPYFNPTIVVLQMEVTALALEKC